MATFKFKKGDLVIVNVNGNPVQFEIVSPLVSGDSELRGTENYYDARESASGRSKTISEDEILRLATPIDNSAELFQKKRNGN